MKIIVSLISSFAFVLVAISGSIAQGQAIQSKSSWSALAANSDSGSDFKDLDEEIEDLEDLASDQNIEDAEFSEISDFDRSSRSSKVTKSRRTKTTLSKKSRPRKRIIRRVIRKKRPRRKARQSEMTTVVSKMAPLPRKAKTNFLITPFAGASVSLIRGDFLKNSFANNIEEYTGLAAGALAEWHPRGSWFGVEFGAHYVQTGANGDAGTAVANTNRLNYICNEYLYLPVNLKLYPVRLANFEMFLKAGVEYGFLLASTFAGTTANNFQYEIDGKDVFKSNDFMGNLGIGGKARVSRNVSVGFELIYNRGFVDISNSLATNIVNLNANGAANLGNDAYNSGFIGTLGVVIDI